MAGRILLLAECEKFVAGCRKPFPYGIGVLLADTADCAPFALKTEYLLMVLFRISFSRYGLCTLTQKGLLFKIGLE